MYKFKLKHIKQGIIKIGDVNYTDENVDSSLIITMPPRNAEDTTIAFSRSDLFMGIFRKFSMKNKWIGDAYDFLKTYIEKESIHVKILVDVYMYNSSILEYELILQNGIMNMDGYTEGVDNGRPYLEMNFEDGAFEQLIMTRKEINIDYTNELSIDNVGISKQHDDFKNVWVVDPFLVSETDNNGVTTTHDYSSNVQCIYPLDLLDRIVEQYTNESGRVISSYFGIKGRGYSENGEGALRMVTKGRFCRGYSTSEASISTNFSDFFKSFGNIFCLGAGIKRINGVPYLTVEKLTNYFSDEVMFKIDSLTDLTFTPNNEIIFNKVISGYENYETKNDDNGQVEFNTKAEYSLPVRYFEKELSLASIYRADGTSVNRLQAIGYQNTVTEKDEMDDSIFIIDSTLKEDGTLKSCESEPFTEITGIYGTVASMMNAAMSPARILFNNSERIQPCLHTLSADKKILIQSNDSMSKLSTRLKDTSYTIVEKKDFQVNDLPESYLSPMVAKFSAPLQAGMIKELNINPHRLVKVWDYINKKWISGWIKEVSTKPIDRNTNWTIWLAKSTSQNDVEYLNFMTGNVIYDMNSNAINTYEQ